MVRRPDSHRDQRSDVCSDVWRCFRAASDHLCQPTLERERQKVVNAQVMLVGR